MGDEAHSRGHSLAYYWRCRAHAEPEQPGELLTPPRANYLCGYSTSPPLSWHSCEHCGIGLANSATVRIAPAVIDQMFNYESVCRSSRTLRGWSGVARSRHNAGRRPWFTFSVGSLLARYPHRPMEEMDPRMDPQTPFVGPRASTFGDDKNGR